VLAIEEGWAKVAHTSAGGEQTLLGLRGPGDVIGELSALDGAPRSAGAVAVGAVVALEVPAEDFARALEDSAAARALIRILADRLRDADRKRIELTTLGTLGRVASRLLEIGERFGAETPDGLRVELPLSQEELATWCGSSREATVKALRQLRELGEITTGRRTVVVHDVAALRAHASVPA
jgi:CRP-like cAMP-binding protein